MVFNLSLQKSWSKWADLGAICRCNYGQKPSEFPVYGSSGGLFS